MKGSGKDKPTPGSKKKRTRQNEVPKNQPKMTMFMKKRETEDDECREESMMRRIMPGVDDEEGKERHKMEMMTPTTVKNNTKTTKSPPILHDLEEKPAGAKHNVKQLTKLFSANRDSKPPPLLPCNNVASEAVHLDSNGRRPSKKSTGHGDISCGREI